MVELRADLVGDSREFQRSVDKGSESVEDLEKSLKDVGKTGDKELDGLTQQLADIPKEAKKADKALDKLGDGASPGMHKASASVGDFKDEAKQNFGEVASSFSGDMASAADLVQGTLGGLAASIGGPLGIALGAASIALGAFLAAAQADAELAKQLRADAAETVGEAFEEGIDPQAFLASTQRVLDRLAELNEAGSKGFEFAWERDISQLEEWQRALEATGQPAEDLATILQLSGREFSAYSREVRRAQDADQDRLRELSQLRSQQGQLTRAQQDEVDALVEQTDARKVSIGYLEDEEARRKAVRSETELQSDAGVEAARKATAAEEEATAAAEDQASRREQLQQQVADSAVAMYDSVRDAAVQAATSDDGVFDVSQWLTLVEQSRVQAETYQQNLAKLKLTPEQWQNLLALPEEARQNIASSLVVSDPETRGRIVASLTDTGSTGGAAASVAFDEAFSPDTATTVDVKADVTQATKTIKATAAAKYQATIKTKTDASLVDAGKALTAMAALPRTATLDVAVDTVQAQRDLDTFWTRNNGRRIRIYTDVVDATGKQPLI